MNVSSWHADEGKQCSQHSHKRLIRIRWVQASEGDANKWFLPGLGVGKDLRAFLTRQHPSMPAALLDPKLPAPWRSSPSRIQKPPPAHGARAHASPSMKDASPQRWALLLQSMHS